MSPKKQLKDENAKEVMAFAAAVLDELNAMAKDGGVTSFHKAMDPGPYKLRKAKDKNTPRWSVIAAKENLLAALLDSPMADCLSNMVALFNRIIAKVGTGPLPGEPKELARVVGRSYYVMLQDLISVRSFPFFHRHPYRVVTVAIVVEVVVQWRCVNERWPMMARYAGQEGSASRARAGAVAPAPTRGRGT